MHNSKKHIPTATTTAVVRCESHGSLLTSGFSKVKIAPARGESTVPQCSENTQETSSKKHKKRSYDDTKEATTVVVGEKEQKTNNNEEIKEKKKKKCTLS